MKKLGDMPAFPVSLPGWGDNGASGLTIRQLLAGQIMAGFAVHNGYVGALPNQAAKFSIEWADALIEALEHPAKPEWTAEEILANEG